MNIIQEKADMLRNLEIRRDNAYRIARDSISSGRTARAWAVADKTNAKIYKLDKEIQKLKKASTTDKIDLLSLNVLDNGTHTESSDVASVLLLYTERLAEKDKKDLLERLKIDFPKFDQFAE